MNEKVSVIIPIYKVEKYIRRCIESIAAQTYHNLEIVLVDDGSPDKCPEICDEYAKNDSRIKVIHKINGGLSDARNAGLKVFTGDYVYFLDGDDYVKNTLIEIALANAVATASELVIFNYERVDEADNLLSTSNFRTGIYEINEESRIDYIINTLSKYVTGWEAWNRLYKADLIRKNNLFFWDNKLIFAEDFGFSLNFALHANKISCIPDALYHYLIRKDSIMSQAANESRLSASLALSKLMEEKIAASFKNSNLYKDFPVLFYSIIYEQLRGLTLDNYKKSISLISDKDYFNKQINRVIKKFGAMFNYYGVIRGIVALLHCIFLKRKMEKQNIRILGIYRKVWKINEVFTNNKSKIFSKRRIFLIGSEDFSNLGEHHIAISEIEYLQTIFPEYAITEITASEYSVVHHILPFIIKRRDLICMPGGGDRGNANSHAVKIQRDIMMKYRNNRIVIFPQVINYDSSKDGINQLGKDQRIIKKCKNLTVCVREQHSYELAKQYFDCNVVLIPDMVLYSNYNSLQFVRKGAILLLQNDIEGVLSKEDKIFIEKVVQQQTRNIQFNDIQLISNISIFDRKEVVHTFIRKLAQTELVVTNRLYGMLFCAITRTPCIALFEHNYKIDGVYEWISKLGYIMIIRNCSELEEAVHKLSRIDKKEYDNTSILEGFAVLTKQLRNNVVGLK
ncbi:MAG: glycosyl transferase family 2 [Herbinix sp.]|jgi:exopolysaccharide biosynthesis predicted pyruvyltransferase EpsI/glycosyltransferase involved in cell wall biosynthesis|nr:glycosyl transferase family 2 [Herbinix sp.]